MVPGSTFKYGSNFSRFTVNPRLSNRHPIEADAKPLPSDETTPPVTKINFFSINKRSPRLSATSSDRLECRSPMIRSQLRQREYDIHARALAIVQVSRQLPEECARALQIFSENPRGKRTDRDGENRSLRMEFSIGKNKGRFHSGR